LLADDAAALERKKELRETPCCPPWLEKKAPPRFSFYLRRPVRAPHHAAVFGPTVWTNVFFASKFIVFGDIIAGPVARLFGPGVLDVRLPIGGPFFRHLQYWAKPMEQPSRYWIRALRRALNLRYHDEVTLWDNEIDSDIVRAERLPEQIAPKTGHRSREAASADALSKPFETGPTGGRRQIKKGNDRVG
jgi:hypothetical protein